MASTWDTIPQTHKTILFEEFTHPLDTSKKTLYGLLNSYKDFSMDSEALHKDVATYLEVKSFDEFLKKFSPTIYEYVEGMSDGSFKIKYTIDPVVASKKYKPHEIDLASHTYFTMLVNMYSQRGTRGVANIEFDDTKIREILTPKSEIQTIYDMRRNIIFWMEKRDAAIKKNENPKSYNKKLDKVVDDASKIKNQSTLVASKLAILYQQIKAADEGILQLPEPSTEGGEQLQLMGGTIEVNKDGEFEFVAAPPSSPDDVKEDSPSNPSGKYLGEMAERMQKELPEKAPDSNPNTQALIISAYTGVDALTTKNPSDGMSRDELIVYRDELLEKKAYYENIYKQMKEAFIEELSKLVQKVLSVKIFFDHATAKGGDHSELPVSGLIVANCKASRFLEDSINESFTQFMEYCGKGVNDKHKIWFAILPQVENDDDDFDEDDEDENIPDDLVTFDEAVSLLKIMEQSRILTFFNFFPKAKTTFSELTAKTVTKLQNKLRTVDFEHAVYAMPNFTIIKSGKVPLSDDKSAEEISISVPAVYIDAAYVAAGLVVAAQQKEFWLDKGFKNKENFLNENACVRVDLESDDISRVLLTKFNRERANAWGAEIIKTFTENRFGFIFDGDGKTYEGKPIDNTYILNARTLRSRDGKYMPIFRTLVKDFINAYLKNGSQVKASDVDYFLNRTISEWRMQRARDKESKIINLILREGEDISRQGDKSQLKVEFADGDDFVTVNVVD